MNRKQIILAALFAGFVTMGISNLTSQNQKLQMQEIRLQSKSAELKKLEVDFKQLNADLELETKSKIHNEEKVRQLETEKQQLEQRKQELERQLQAKKAEKERIAKLRVTPKVYASGSFGGSCDAWIAAAGINEVSTAKELIRRESGCNAYAVNRSSGACGVAQELPCGKSGCSLGDGACQVRWMNSYVLGRYGSWGAALSFHNRNSWY